MEDGVRFLPGTWDAPRWVSEVGQSVGDTNSRCLSSAGTLAACPLPPRRASVILKAFGISKGSSSQSSHILVPSEEPRIRTSPRSAWSWPRPPGPGRDHQDFRCRGHSHVHTPTVSGVSLSEVE